MLSWKKTGKLPKKIKQIYTIPPPKKKKTTKQHKQNLLKQEKEKIRHDLNFASIFTDYLMKKCRLTLKIRSVCPF